MTDLRQAAQQALECIERCNKHGWILADYEDEVYAAITALREALAQDKLRGLENLMEESITALKAALEKPEQEPFSSEAIRATQTAWKMGYEAAKAEMAQQAEPLTDESIWQIATDYTTSGDLHAYKFARAIEARLKKRNNG